MRSSYKLLGGGKKTKPNGRPGKKTSMKKRSPVRKLFGALSILSLLVAVALGILVLAGCTTSPMQSFYLAELSLNKTYEVQLNVGYFGGCASITNKTGGPSISDDSSSGSSQTHCLKNFHGHDDDDIAEELWEDLKLTDPAVAEMKDSLTKALPVARHLQGDVFPWAPPLFHLILLAISGPMLSVAVTNSTVKRSYKILLVLSTLMGGFALALVYLTTIGSLQSLNGLVNGSRSKDSDVLQGEIVIHRANRLFIVQMAQVVFVSLFYVVIGGMFIV